MGRKHYTVEQIIRKLREAEVELAQGSKMLDNASLKKASSGNF